MGLLDFISPALTLTAQGVTAMDEGRRERATQDEARTLAGLERLREEDDRKRRMRLDKLNEQNIFSQIRARDAEAARDAATAPQPKPPVRGTPEYLEMLRQEAETRSSVAPARTTLPTESERKAAAFYASGRQGYETLERLIGDNPDTPERESPRSPPSWMAQQAAKIGIGAGNVLTSADVRRMRQSALMLSDAWLRYTSGAAVPEQEVERFAESFIPRAGDDAATLQQKAEARAVIIEALRKGAGRALDPNAVGVQDTQPPNVIDRYQLEPPE